MTFSNLPERARGWYVRRTVRWFHRRPLTIKSEVPIISFTFDDFPKSALLNGGAILNQSGLAGTYYAALGLMGKQSPTGIIFEADDLHQLKAFGHELGCHTYGHLSAWKTKARLYKDSIEKNRQALREILPGEVLETHSYPIHVPVAAVKQKASRHYLCSRSGGQCFNAGTTDLNYLYSFFLEKSRDDIGSVRNLIDQNRDARGWLIFSTHDVCNQPTAFGCTPSFFEKVVRYSVNSGARILPVVQACKLLRGDAVLRATSLGSSR